MTLDKATAFVTRYAQAWNQRDVACLTAFYDGNAVVLSAVFGELRGRDSIQGSYEKLFAALPEFVLQVNPQEILVDGSRIVLFVRFQFSLPTLGDTPSGARIDVRPGVIVLTFSGERIVHEHRLWDEHALHQSSTTAGLRLRRPFTDMLEKISLDRELKTAADVQRALLPHEQVAGGYCDVAGASIPCRTIGGDFFEHVELPSGDIGIAIGDVSGKGLPAALLTSLLQGIFAVEAEAGRGPAAMMSSINRVLIKRSIESRFATFFYGMLTSDGRFTYANAGHNPPILLSRESRRSLTTGGSILGAFPDAAFDEETVDLKPGDSVVCFTDGVTEAMDAQGEEFGEARMLSCLNACAADLSTDVIGRVFGAVRQFCGDTAQRDDITMLVVRFVPK